jgi:hypothetical protein
VTWIADMMCLRSELGDDLIQVSLKLDFSSSRSILPIFSSKLGNEFKALMVICSNCEITAA